MTETTTKAENFMNMLRQRFNFAKESRGAVGVNSDVLAKLIDIARCDVDTVLRSLNTSLEGLSDSQSQFGLYEDPFLSQGSLTGQSIPVEKYATLPDDRARIENPLELDNLCFIGTNFVPLPTSYIIWLVLILLSYCVLTQLMKIWFVRKYGYN
jgi:hypothetical protein